MTVLSIFKSKNHFIRIIVKFELKKLQGWYYESRVLDSLGDGKFKLANKFKDVKEVYREDIMFKSNTGKFDVRIFL